jgi:hypothetical protein
MRVLKGLTSNPAFDAPASRGEGRFRVLHGQAPDDDLSREPIARAG